MPTRFLRNLAASDREQFLETLLRSASDYAIITLDPDGMITGWNVGAQAILGWSEAEVLGKPGSLIFTPEDRASGVPREEMSKALANGSAGDDRWHVRQDGSRFWAHCSIMPLIDGTGYLKILRDRSTERELRQVQDSLRMAVEATGIGTFDMDPRTGEGHWDERARALFGLPPDATIDYERTFLAGLHPEDRGRVDAAIQRVLDPSGPRIYEEEYRVVRHDDGSTRWVAARGVTQVEDGHTVRFVGTAWDVTSRRQAEVGLGQAVERYRLITQATNDVIWDWDLKRDHVLWNEALMTAYGYDPAGIPTSGEWWIAHIHPDDRDRVEEHIRSVIHGTQNDWSHEYRFRRADGSYADVLDRGYMVRSSAGAPQRMIGAMQDISQRKQAEQRLRLVHQELGHRLKNVLTMVQAIASQTLRNAPSMEAARDILAARLVTMGKAQDVLLAGSLEAADIGAVLDAALEPHGGPGAGRFRLRGPELHLNPGPALSLALLVHELATNAIKYGALSVENGYVDLVWTLTDGDPACLALRWSEHGGPKVMEPSRRGFGSRLITLGLGGDGSGNVELDFEPTGVVCTLTAPLAGLAAELAAGA
jgi:PAS domain S-box-containing protein